MGSSLILNSLEIRNGVNPNWKAANAVVDAMTEEQSRVVYAQGMDYGELTDGDYRPQIFHALDDCMMGWEGDRRGFAVLPMRYTTIFVNGGSSDGDQLDGHDEFNIFIASGAAEAAGFLTWRQDPEPKSLISEEGTAVVLRVDLSVMALDKDSPITLKEAQDSAQEAVAEALCHAENRGYNHPLDDTMGIGFNIIEAI